MAFLDLKDLEDIGVQLGLLEILENLVLLVQEDLRERQVILGRLENKEKLESLVAEGQGDQQGNRETQEAKVCLEWREGLDLLVPLDPQDPLVILSLWPLLPCKERLCQEFLGHLDPWDLLDPLGREEPMVSEALREAGESLAWPDPLELLADRDSLADLEIQESLVNQADLDDPTLRMT